jgi:HK97 family phage major capsid protein
VAMPCPSIITKVYRRGLRFAGPIGRRGTIKRAVNAYLVVNSQLALTPHNAGGYTEISRQLLLQSPRAADVVLNIDLPRGLAVSIDYAGIQGTGTGGQPLGIVNYPTSSPPAAASSVVNTITGTSIALAGIVKFQTSAAVANSSGLSFAYVANPAVASVLKQRQQFSGSSLALWQGDLFATDDVCGSPGMSSEQVPSGTLIGGPWANMIMATWADLEISIDPYSNFAAGIIGVRAFMTCDIGCRYPGAFSIAPSVT